MLHPYASIAHKDQYLKIWKLYGKYCLRYETLKMDNSAFLHISARLQNGIHSNFAHLLNSHLYTYKSFPSKYLVSELVVVSQ